jgi:hypothetical protein
MKYVIATLIAVLASTATFANNSNQGTAKWHGNVSGVCKVQHFAEGVVTVVTNSNAVDSSNNGGQPVRFEVVANSTDFKLNFGNPTVKVDGAAVALGDFNVTFTSKITHRSGQSTNNVTAAQNSIPKKGKSDVELHVRLETKDGDPVPAGQYNITAPVTCAK